jgi:carbamoyltransferase
VGARELPRFGQEAGLTVNILGICGGVRLGNWDSAAALVIDGQIVAAAEEERFIRVKHAPGNLPTHAIDYCLGEARLDIRDVDLLVFPGRTYRNMTSRLTEYFRFVFGHAPRIELCDHHEAHAASAYFTSGFDDALVVTFDLSGDRRATTVSRAAGNRIELLECWEFPQSLGLFYAMITQHLGFDFGEDEYKVMGLASYGRPTVDLSWLLRSGEGTYSLAPDILRTTGEGEPPFSPQERFYGPQLAARLGQPRHKKQELQPFHSDLAASAQRLLETTVLSLVRPFAVRCGSRNLCLAGGVAMNCVMNQKLAESGDFDGVYIPPVAGDAGLALGAALLFAPPGAERAREGLRTAAWGPGYGDGDIRRALDEVRASYREVSDPAGVAAEAIARGRIVGWYQGRMEYGARALGHRSILADPCVAEMKDRVNAVVKFREGFRPFAPSVTRDAAEAYFERVYDSPFMTATFTVRPPARQTIPAVTHADGTARIQTVSAQSEALYHRLLTEVAARTGVPVVLNTSFNIRGQPIVENPHQAISTFHGSGLDLLVAGSFVLEKRG